MQVTVIIPTYNEEKSIGKCLESLRGQKLRDFEVIVVDDESTDKTCQQLRSFGGRANYKLRILEQKHQGPAVARNLGASRAKGKILVFVDADMFFEDDFLENLVGPIDGVGVKGTNSHDEEVGNWENVWARCWNYNQNKDKGMLRRRAKTDRVFRAVLKSEFNKVGGFDKGGYTDDYSLSAKLGYEAKVVGGKFYHNNPDSLREVFVQAKWVGKRKYKMRWMGVVIALFRVSLPIAKIVGIYKAIKYKTLAFLPFKIVYNTGVTLGIAEYYLMGKGAK